MAAMRHSLDPNVDPRAHLFPVNDVFECADGRRLTLGILEEHFWQNFVSLVPELDRVAFSSDAARRKNGDELSRILSETMRQRPAEEWIRLLEENDVPFDLCLKPGEAAQLEHLQQRQAVERGYAKFPVWADGRPGGRIRSGPPELGGDSRGVPGGIGFDDSQNARMGEVGGGKVECNG